MSSRYATPRELREILRRHLESLQLQIGLGFVQMSLPVDANGRVQDFIEVQVRPEQADDLPPEVSVQLGDEVIRVRLHGVQPVQRYVPLRATGS